jgi:aspartate/methionine/tyrosine aminotransferase
MINEFQLKSFFNTAAARSARGTLSASYAELMTIEHLLSMDEGAHEAYVQVPLGYAPLNGGAELRALIANFIGGVHADDIMVTAGSDDAIALLQLVLLTRGDHVIVHAPAYQPLVALAEWRGARVDLWHADEGQGWALSLDTLQRLITHETRLIIVNIPHNPTGWHPERTFINELIAMAERHGILIISDEVYAGLSLVDGVRFVSLASLSPQVISLGSLTKVFGMPGIRIGWLATENAQVLALAQRMRMHLNSFATTPGEFLACQALKHASGILSSNQELARANLGHLASYVDTRSDLFAWQRPLAGTVCFPRWNGPGTTTELSERCFQATGYVLAASAHFLAGTQHVRLGFSTKAFPDLLGMFREFIALEYAGR